MDDYTIEYVNGGKTSCERAESHIEAITKNASKSISKARFFETFPQIDPNHFIVKNTKTKEVKYYKMIIEN